MLSAVLADFRRVPGLRVETVHEYPEEQRFRELARAADYTLVIAPEFDDILWTRCRWVEEAGGKLLGPSADAVKRTGDKLRLARHLMDHGVPTPPVVRSQKSEVRSQKSEVRSQRRYNTDLGFPAVWKPRYGAGSQATFLVHTAAELAACADQARTEGWRGESILQPFVPGLPASVALLLGPRQQMALLPGEQTLSTEGRFRYHGGTLPLPPQLGERAIELAWKAVRAVPGLQGYMGVDLVLGEASDGSQDWVIEINPRLTTSYVGLRALAETNLAEAMLRIVAGSEVPCLKWRPGAVQFQADGGVQFV